MSEHYEVYALKFAEHPGGLRGEYLYGSAAEPHSTPMQLDYYVWLMRSQHREVVLDLGYTADTAARRIRTYFESPSEALAGIGTDLDRVEHVVVSHMHYDHVGDWAAFPNARFVLQDDEMAFWTGRYLHRHEIRRLVEVDDLVSFVQLSHAGRVEFVDGTREIAPGLRVHKVGGHSPGMQIVTVETARGTVVLASDASHFYENVENDAPFGILNELPGMYRTFDRMRDLASSAELIIPGHDPDVLNRFPQVDGGDGRVVRIA